MELAVRVNIWPSWRVWCSVDIWLKLNGWVQLHRTVTLYYETRDCVQADHLVFVLLGVIVVLYDVDVRGCQGSKRYG
jgi:hypothetical protein